MNKRDDLNILLRSNEQINDIMRNKNKFVITKLNNQHIYSMRRNQVDKNNSKSQDKALLLQQQKNDRKSQSSGTRSLQQLRSLNSNHGNINSQMHKEQSEYLNYALELGTLPQLYTRGQTIQQMLENAGHDVSTKNQQVKVENELQNSLKKRTFYNCNRGMGLFEPKISQFNPRSEIHRIKLRTKDPLALLLHYTVNQSISTEPLKNQAQNTIPYISPNSSQINTSKTQQILKQKTFSEKDSQKFLDGVLRQGYVEGLNKAVFQNETILKDEQIEKTFLIENPLYNKYMQSKREINNHENYHLPKIKQSQPNLYIKYKEESQFLGKDDESFIQKISQSKYPQRKSLQFEEYYQSQ